MKKSRLLQILGKFPFSPPRANFVYASTYIYACGVL